MYSENVTSNLVKRVLSSQSPFLNAHTLTKIKCGTTENTKDLFKIVIRWNKGN